MLRELDYEVSLAINGRLALEALRERTADLVITDLMMPVMDGVELGTALRNSEAHRRIPIVLMTSLPTAVPHQSYLFDAVIRKPFTPELLVRTVNDFLGNPPNDTAPLEAGQ
jgi:CheY-like chemotaxis protein